MTKKQIAQEIEDMHESNEILKQAALMVGFDVEKETEKVESQMDRRVRINIWQKHRIAFLESLVTDGPQP